MGGFCDVQRRGIGYSRCWILSIDADADADTAADADIATPRS